MSRSTKDGKNKIWKTVIILGFVAYVGTNLVSQQISLNNYRHEAKELDALIAAQESKYSQLEQSELEYSSDEFIEKIARDRLGFIRSDETVFVGLDNN